MPLIDPTLLETPEPAEDTRDRREMEIEDMDELLETLWI